MWRDYLNTEYALEDGILYLRAIYPAVGHAFAPPQGSTGRQAYEQILRFCTDSGVPARICAVSEVLAKAILRMFPGSIMYTDRAWSDYLYMSEDIRSLPGRKFSGQRNHINRFMREYPAWSFERVTAENLHKVRDFMEKYSSENLRDSPAYDEGNRKTIEVLDNLELYGMFGGALCVGVEVIGLSLGEAVGDTLFIHVEKADTAYHGSYPALMNQFAQTFVSGGIEFINREEDDGVEGLRTSKLSYHPVALLDKYVVEIR